jgi:glycine/D-amino acid oxidase-like deaminating enzyme
MKRVYELFGYSDGPVEQCYWDTTTARPARSAPLAGDVHADIAIIGAGFTGLSAALHLARDAGADVAVIEANGVGWGASGRNGGFASIGGTKARDATLLRRFGKAAMDEWHEVQRETPAIVTEILDHYGIDADTHSHDGEVVLAHRPRDFAALRHEASDLARAYGVETKLIGRDELAGNGMGGTEFHGGMRLGLGFALNPLKYVLGLASAARTEGARIYENSPVTGIGHENGRHVLQTETGRLIARKLIIATNGYSSDDVPGWMAGRYLPAQSAVLVTRKLTPGEIAAQGWSSMTMAYDTRNLLHYFRLMPNGHFLFGARGGTSASQPAVAERKAGLRADFEAMFPAWSGVDTPHYWSGFVCLTRALTPYIGAIDGAADAWAGFGWHGNGVALGTWAGRCLARIATGQGGVPALMAPRPGRIPFGRARRHILPLAYRWYDWSDRG